ncbi:uncharacterized protein LOC144162019 isoform X1 [Haemaphysalis longicornis]
MITLVRNVRHMEPRVLLMTGTNDLHQARTMGDAHRLIADLELVLESLLHRGCEVAVLTLPPLARAARSSAHWRILNAGNAWIVRLHIGTIASLYEGLRRRITCSLRYFHADGVVPVEIHRLFVLGRRRVRYCLYERRMGSDRRVDMLHWNAQAMDRVAMVLRDVIGG